MSCTPRHPESWAGGRGRTQQLGEPLLGDPGVLPERSFSQGVRPLAENEDAFSPLVSPL